MVVWMWGFEMKTRDNLTNKTFSNLLVVSIKEKVYANNY